MSYLFLILVVENILWRRRLEARNYAGDLLDAEDPPGSIEGKQSARSFETLTRRVSTAGNVGEREKGEIVIKTRPKETKLSVFLQVLLESIMIIEPRPPP